MSKAKEDETVIVTPEVCPEAVHIPEVVPENTSVITSETKETRKSRPTKERMVTVNGTVPPELRDIILSNAAKNFRTPSQEIHRLLAVAINSERVGA